MENADLDVFPTVRETIAICIDDKCVVCANHRNLKPGVRVKTVVKKVSNSTSR